MAATEAAKEWRQLEDLNVTNDFVDAVAAFMDLAEGLGLAAESLDSGQGREVLTRWRAYSAAKA